MNIYIFISLNTKLQKATTTLGRHSKETATGGLPSECETRLLRKRNNHNAINSYNNSNKVKLQHNRNMERFWRK